MNQPVLQTEVSPDGSLWQKLLRGIGACALLAVCAGILSFAMTDSSAANRDFVSYWAAGQRLVHHSDPYDASAILALEKSTGWSAGRPLIMRNAPFALFLTLPLGVMGEKTGAVLWSLSILVSLMISIRLVWNMHGRPPNRLHLIGYIFAPSLACLMAGQTSAFVLLGLTLFLYFHDTKPMLAGAALLLCTLKPHLFLPFGVVLLAWIVAQKTYRVLAGSLFALAVSCIVPLFFDPSVYGHYAAMARTTGIEAEFMPTVGELLRIAVHVDSVWLQFLPAMAGCLWAFWYFLRKRHEWNWRTHGQLLMLVSLLVAPYCWLTDQVVLVPAILYAIYAASAALGSRSLYVFAALDAVVLIEVLSSVQLDSALYVWTPAAWLAWYLWSMRNWRASGSALAAA